MTDKRKQQQIKELKGVIEEFALAKWDTFNSATLAEAIINAGYFRHKPGRSKEHLITYKGETKRLSCWAREFGISKSTLVARLNRGWNTDDALTIPVDTRMTGRPNHPVEQYTKDNKLVKVWNSAIEAAEEFNVGPDSIRLCASGRTPNAAGYVWRWADDCRANEKPN